MDSIRALEAWSGGVFTTDYGKAVTARGVCWSRQKAPTTGDSCTNEGGGFEAFESHMNGLEPDQTYYVRAYATNADTTVYGGEQTMHTRDGRVRLSTGQAAQITAFSARVRVELQDDGGAAVVRWGLCYDHGQSPGLDKQCLQEVMKSLPGPQAVARQQGQGLLNAPIALAPDTTTAAEPAQGIASGGDPERAMRSTSWDLEELEPGRRYYVRSFAENLAGVSYGPEITFETRDGRPVLTTRAVSGITTTSAQSGGEISDDGGAPVTARGVCWSTTQNPTTSNTCTSNGSGTGSFTSSITNLNPDTRYYVRAYATNAAGTAYGSQREFRTQASGGGSWPRDTNTSVVDVRNPATGRTWMDRNLGASRRATSSTDSQAYGDLYQWGRAADGHQRRNSPTTSTLSSTNQPGHGSFILAPNSPWDWRSPQNNNLWLGVNGINNPCPSGYRLPTEAEWNAERNSWGSNNESGAFNSPLRLPVAGSRRSSSGSLDDVGSFGFYWSGTADGSLSRRLSFSSSSAFMYSNLRAFGFSVRCLKN